MDKYQANKNIACKITLNIFNFISYGSSAIVYMYYMTTNIYILLSPTFYESQISG